MSQTFCKKKNSNTKLVLFCLYLRITTTDKPNSETSQTNFYRLKRKTLRIIRLCVVYDFILFFLI